MTLTKTTHLHNMFMDWPTTPLATLRRATVPALETMRARSRYRLNQRNCSIVLPECLRDNATNRFHGHENPTWHAALSLNEIPSAQ